VRVASTFYGAQTAVYREHLGCTLVHDITEAELRAQPMSPLKAPELSPNEPWPFGRGGIDYRARESLDAERLDRALDALMAEPSEGPVRQTTALAIVHDGKLIAERYAPGYDARTPFLGWSMSKSVTATLMGVLVRTRGFDIYARAKVAAWDDPKDPRHAITTDQLLRMSSGLRFVEKYGPLSDVSEMLYLHDDMAAFAASLPLEAAPDTRWNYSTGTTNVLSRILFDQAGASLDAYYRFAYQELFAKLGMRSVVFEPDATGVLSGGSYVYMSARDFARLGQLWLDDGVWAGERILPEGWMKYCTTPTPTEPGQSYGAQFWLNHRVKGYEYKQRWPELPEDTFAASGHHGQYLMVVPSRSLVAVRLGVTFDGTARGHALREGDIQFLVKEALAALEHTSSAAPAPP
jgi:CubicO group peptidase (beta-lactamase class C family)